jgi:hypothetical protein
VLKHCLEEIAYTPGFRDFMMVRPDEHRSRLRVASRRLGASAGPLSLLFLPKCPLCLLPLTAALGIGLPSSAMIVAAGVVGVSLWLGFVFFATRRHSHPRLCLAAVAAATLGLSAIVTHNLPLLFAGVTAMMVTGLLLARECGRHSVNATTFTARKLDSCSPGA